METTRVVMLVIGLPIIREPIEAALRLAGFDVVAADSAPAALALLSGKRINAVVIDLDLQGRQAWSLLSSLRASQHWAGLPVLVLSSHADKSVVVRAGKHHVAAFVLKAKFSLESFVEKLRQAVAAGPAPHNSSADSGAAPLAGVRTSVTGNRSSPVEPGLLPEAAQACDSSDPAAADPATVLRSVKPMITRAEMTDCIDRCEQLKGFSPTVTQLMKITSSPSCSIQSVIKAAGQDHAIALKILKLANSVAYGRGDPVDALKTAVMRIGLDKIRQAVMNIGLIEQFIEGTGAVNIPHFWEHAIGCAVISGELAHATGEVDSEAAFTAGLLHDVGRIVLAEQLGERYTTVLAKARELRLPLEQVESRMLLINHADVMDRLLHTWKFSKHLTNPVVFHHLSAGGIRQTCPREIPAVATLALANRLAHAMLLGTSGNDTVYPTEELCQSLNIDGATIATVCDLGPAQTMEMKISLLSSGSTGNWKSYKDEVVGALRFAARILFTSVQPSIDAYRVLCQSIAGTAGGEGLEAPNVGVVHIPHVRDVVMVSTRYTSAEEQAACGRLPLIVISPLGQLNVESRLAMGREVRRLPSPLNVHEFVDVLNDLAGAAASPQLARLAA